MSDLLNLQTKDVFSFAFEGESEINAGLLGSTLSNLAFVLTKVAEDDPAKPKCELKVKTFKKGSFSVDLVVALTQAAQMVGINSIQDAASVFSIIKGMFDIKLHLKGSKPKEVRQDLIEGCIHVVDPFGSEVVAPIGSKVLIDVPEVDRRISQIASATRLHNPTGGFRLEHGEEVVRYDENDVQDIAIETPVSEQLPSNTSRTIRVRLLIKTLNLIGNGAWSFKFGQRTISASIIDRHFLKDVHEGKTSYKAGDHLDVDLTIDTKLSANNEPQGDTYTIEKVYGVISSGEQLHM